MSTGSKAALELAIALKGQAEAAKGLDGLAKKGSILHNALGFVAGGAITAGIGAITGSVTDFFKSAVDESGTWTAAMQQTDAVLKSTGGSAGVTKTQVEDLANSLSGANGLSKFADDAVASGENLLLTFTGIGKDVFPQTTQTMLDMSQAMGQDLKTSAIQLGKALNDPTQGLSALSRVGVTFTQEQKDQVKAMQEAGNTAGAQKIILAELGKEFGGSALAAAKTFDGQMFTLGEKFNNVKQSIGDKLIPVLGDLATFIGSPEVMGTIQGLADLLVNGISAGINGLGLVIKAFQGDGQPLIDFFTNLGGPLGNAGTFLVNVISNITEFTTAISNGQGLWESFGTLIANNAGALGNLIGLGPQAQAFFNDLLGPAGAVSTAITAITTNAHSFMDAFFGGDSKAKQQELDIRLDGYSGKIRTMKTDTDNFWLAMKTGLDKSGNDWNTFWESRKTDHTTNLTRWDEFWKTTGENFEGFRQKWERWWIDNGAQQDIHHTRWEKWWGDTKTNFDKFGQDWNQFWVDRKTDKEADGTRWDEFWTKTGTEFGAFGTGWNDFWSTQSLKTGQHKTDWQLFWQKQGEDVDAHSTKWDVYWKEVQTQSANMRTNWDQFWAAEGTAITNFKTNWDNFWHVTKTNFDNFGIKWNNFWNGVASFFKEVGGNIVAGVKQGIEDAWNGLVGWFQGKLGELLGGAQQKNESKSPSLLWAREVGLPIVQGIQLGITKGWSDLQADLFGKLGSLPEIFDASILKIEQSGKSFSDTLKNYLGGVGGPESSGYHALGVGIGDPIAQGILSGVKNGLDRNSPWSVIKHAFQDGEKNFLGGVGGPGGPYHVLSDSFNNTALQIESQGVQFANTMQTQFSALTDKAKDDSLTHSFNSDFLDSIFQHTQIALGKLRYEQFEPFMNWLRPAWADLANGLATSWESAWNDIVSATKNDVDAILAQIARLPSSLPGTGGGGGSGGPPVSVLPSPGGSGGGRGVGVRGVSGVGGEDIHVHVYLDGKQMSGALYQRTAARTRGA